MTSAPPPRAARLEREAAFHDERNTDDSARAPSRKFYRTAEKARTHFLDLITPYGRSGVSALEVGCGNPHKALALAEQGATVTAIDIAPAVVADARARCADATSELTFQVMSVEEIKFDDESFDLIYGTGVLHHLDLPIAAAEMARVLKPGGVAIFHEPLGHNKLIERYRRRTPEMRSVDEQPLMTADMAMLRATFGSMEAWHFGLSTLAVTPLVDKPGFDSILRGAERVDAAIFRAIPFSRRYAWMVNLLLTGPAAAANSATTE